MTELDLRYQSSKDVTKSTILGFFIGLAVIVPGISGSTMAIIFKLYDKLLYAMGNLFKSFKLCILFLLYLLCRFVFFVVVVFVFVLFCFCF